VKLLWGDSYRRNALRRTIIMLQVLYKKACNQAKKMVDINDGVFIYFLENVLIKRVEMQFIAFQKVEMRCIASQKGVHRISKRVRD